MMIDLFYSPVWNTTASHVVFSLVLDSICLIWDSQRGWNSLQTRGRNCAPIRGTIGTPPPSSSKLTLPTSMVSTMSRPICDCKLCFLCCPVVTPSGVHVKRINTTEPRASHEFALTNSLSRTQTTFTWPPTAPTALGTCVMPSASMKLRKDSQIASLSGSLII